VTEGRENQGQNTLIRPRHCSIYFFKKYVFTRQPDLSGREERTDSTAKGKGHSHSREIRGQGDKTFRPQKINKARGFIRHDIKRNRGKFTAKKSMI